jgi:hypothetical protein
MSCAFVAGRHFSRMSTSTTEPPVVTPLEDPHFETVGFFEEFWNAETGMVMGTRPCQYDAHRELGAAGHREQTLTADIMLERGRGTPVPVKASKKAPVRVFTQIQRLCGKKKWRHPMDV